MPAERNVERFRGIRKTMIVHAESDMLLTATVLPGDLHHPRVGIDADARPEARRKPEKALTAAGADIEHSVRGPQVRGHDLLVFPRNRLPHRPHPRKVPPPPGRGARHEVGEFLRRVGGLHRPLQILNTCSHPTREGQEVRSRSVSAPPDSPCRLARLLPRPERLVHPLERLITPSVRVPVRAHHVEGVHARLDRRVAARGERPRARPRLLQLADLPVLPVGQVPELDRVARVEIRLRHRLGREVPLAGHQRPPRRLRPDHVGHQVVRVQAEEQVRPDHEVVDPLQVLGLDPRHQRPGVDRPVHRERLVVAHDLHPGAVPRPRPTPSTPPGCTA